MSMSVGSGGGEDEVIMDINTTPLIDVMLVLLVMLIITIPIQLHSVNLNLPTGNPPPPLVKPEILKVDIDFARASGLRIKEGGTIEVNRFSLETSRPRFFAGGDAITGASNVSNAMAFGKLAARTIDSQLMEGGRWTMIQPRVEYSQTPPEDPSPSRRHRGRDLDAATRVKSLIEVVAGLGEEEMREESARCLRCDLSATDES